MKNNVLGQPQTEKVKCFKTSQPLILLELTGTLRKTQ